MKSALTLCCTSLLLLSLTACTLAGRGQYIKTDAQGQVTYLQRQINIEGVQYKISAKLSAAPTLDTTGNMIVALPEGSYIHIHSSKDNLSLIIENSDSNTDVSLSLDDKIVNASPQIQQLTLMLFRYTPIAAKSRVNTLLTYQGADSVLNEISLISDQESKRIYISELGLQAVLTEQQQLLLIGNTAAIESDYELTELLLQLTKAQPKQPAVQKAILEASLGIGSDYEKRRLMSQLAQPGSGFNLSLILQSCQDIESDYEMGQLLQQIAPQVRDNNTLDALLVAAQSMQSSYELKQALALLPFERFTTTQNEHVINLAAKAIESDYELANLLIELLHGSQHPSALQKVVTEALKTVNSDSDKVRVFQSLY